MKKFLNCFVFCIMGFFLLSLFLFADKNENVKSEKENRFLANPPQAKFLSPEYKKQFSAWLSDHIVLRTKFLSLKNFIATEIFNTKISFSNGVETGKNGFRFFSMETEDFTHKFTQDELEEITATLQKISNFYESQGKEYIFIIHPEKSSVYPENLYLDTGGVYFRQNL